jgi:hypothetical protein
VLPADAFGANLFIDFRRKVTEEVRRGIVASWSDYLDSDRMNT